METIFEIFNEYGWWGLLGIVLCAVVVLCAYYIKNRLTADVSTGLEKVGEALTNQLSKQNDQLTIGLEKISENLTTQLSKQNEQLTSTIVSQQEKLINYLIDKEDKENANHSNMLNERMILAEDINMKLKDIMNIHNSQRAFILEFHNSYQNLSGVPFAKFSCNYEWFDKGMIPLGYRMIGLPFSSIANIVLNVIKSPNKPTIYNDVEKLKDDNPQLRMYIDEDVKTIIYTGLHDNNNILIGLLVLEYTTDVNSDNINLNQLCIQGAELTSLLNIRYKYTKK